MNSPLLLSSSFSLLLLAVIFHGAEAFHRQSLILNSTICGPIYAVPQSGYTVYGRSGGQDQIIQQMERDCSPTVECVAYQCFTGRVLYGPSVVKCDRFTRKWSTFPYCDLPMDDICFDPSPIDDPSYKCWRKRQRWRYQASSGRCVQIETCLRSPPLGGRIANLFLTEDSCRGYCNTNAIRERRAQVSARPTLKTSTIRPIITDGDVHSNQTKYDGSGAPDFPLPGVSTQNPFDYNDMAGIANMSAGGNLGSLGGNIAATSLETVNQTEVLDSHNHYRRGLTPPAPAKPLPDLKWDADLAAAASKYASHCPEAEQPMKSRQMSKFPSIGQNIAFSSWEDREWSSIVDFWAEERIGWIYGIGAREPFLVVEHWVQLVSENTTSVGCAKVKCPSPPAKWLYTWVCNYAPAGLDTQRPYRV